MKQTARAFTIGRRKDQLPLAAASALTGSCGERRQKSGYWGTCPLILPMVGPKEMGVSSPGKGDEDSKKAELFSPFSSCPSLSDGDDSWGKRGWSAEGKTERTPRVAYHKQQMEIWPKIKKGEDK